jgi:tetrahydromethanopterin S-methyltransferase subunit C
MDWIIAVGSLSLGILIGAIVGWYFSESKIITLPVLAGCISALVGSSVLAMFSFLAGKSGPTHEYWFYPVGLLIGFVVVIGLELMHYNYYGERRDRNKG